MPLAVDCKADPMMMVPSQNMANMRMQRKTTTTTTKMMMTMKKIGRTKMCNLMPYYLKRSASPYCGDCIFFVASLQ